MLIVSRIVSKTVLPVLVSTWAAYTVLGAAGPDTEPTPLELFEQRIMPIFKSAQPSSCVQCHLAAVDLKDYILPSHEKTFASLRDQGLIDLDHPEESKILGLITMGEKDLDEGARLIHARTRQAEYAAFAAWIEACCADPALRQFPVADSSGRARPQRADAVIRHARKSRVVDSFVRNVWSQRMRCFPCHTPHEIDATNPQHRRPIARVKEFEARYGKELAEGLKIFRETPEATLQFLIEQSRKTPADRLPLINLENPQKSLIVLKPTSRLPAKVGDGHEKPSCVEPVSHMGGLKMRVDDQSYKAFVSWIRDYAKVVGDRYAAVDELPADNWYASKHVIMVRRVPKDWAKFDRVQFFVHAWDQEKAAWQSGPIAFTQGIVTPRRAVVGSLFLLRPAAPEAEGAKEWDPEDATLAPGKYLLKAFVDSKRRLARDPTRFLGEDDFYGQTEIRARWGKGFKNVQKVPGRLFGRPPTASGKGRPTEDSRQISDAPRR